MPVGETVAAGQPLIVDILQREKQSGDCLPRACPQDLRLREAAGVSEKPASEALPASRPTSRFLLFQLRCPQQRVRERAPRDRLKLITNPRCLQEQNLLADFIGRQHEVAQEAVEVIDEQLLVFEELRHAYAMKLNGAL